MAGEITYDEFLAVDIRIGTVIEARPFPEARKPAIILMVDFGRDRRQKVLSADHSPLPPEQLVEEVVAFYFPRQIGPVARNGRQAGEWPNYSKVPAFPLRKRLISGHAWPSAWEWGFQMKLLISTALALGLLGVLPSAAMATSCYDLWYARNAIYDDNGYCFSTELAQDTFDNSDCWTKHPHFEEGAEANQRHHLPRAAARLPRELDIFGQLQPVEQRAVAGLDHADEELQHRPLAVGRQRGDGCVDAAGLSRRQHLEEVPALVGGVEQALAAVGGAGLLLDIAVVDQLAAARGRGSAW